VAKLLRNSDNARVRIPHTITLGQMFESSGRVVCTLHRWLAKQTKAALTRLHERALAFKMSQFDDVWLRRAICQTKLAVAHIVFFASASVSIILFCPESA